MTRGIALRLAALLVASSSIAATQAPRAKPLTMDVYKTPTCGCCSKWVDHMRAAKFETRVVDMPQAELDRVKAKHRVPYRLHSCHTAIVNGYVVEGHIPADVVQRFLKERPAVVGLAVPGMPIGSPGMEVPGARTRPYEVLTFNKEGELKVFTTVTPR